MPEANMADDRAEFWIDPQSRDNINFNQNVDENEMNRPPADDSKLKEVPVAWLNRLIPCTEPMKSVRWRQACSWVFFIDDHGVLRPLDLERVQAGEMSHFRQLSGLPYNVGEILQQFTSLPITLLYHYVTMGLYLKALFHRQRLVDTIIHVRDRVFAAHRVVLACHSMYFAKAFLASKQHHHKMAELHLRNIDPTVFNIVLSFLYTGQLYVNQDNVDHLLDIAHQLQISAVLFKCLDYLGRLPPHKAIDVVAEPPAKTVINQAYKLLDTPLREVVNTPAFLSMGIESLELALGQDDLLVYSELEVFKAALQWIQYDVKGRKKFLDRLMQQVRFAYMRSGEVIQAAQNTPLIQTSPYCKNRIMEAIWLMTLRVHEAKDKLECDPCEPRNYLVDGGEQLAEDHYFENLDNVQYDNLLEPSIDHRLQEPQTSVGLVQKQPSLLRHQPSASSLRRPSSHGLVSQQPSVRSVRRGSSHESVIQLPSSWSLPQEPSQTLTAQMPPAVSVQREPSVYANLEQQQQILEEPQQQKSRDAEPLQQQEDVDRWILQIPEARRSFNLAKDQPLVKPPAAKSLSTSHQQMSRNALFTDSTALVTEPKEQKKLSNASFHPQASLSAKTLHNQPSENLLQKQTSSVHAVQQPSAQSLQRQSSHVQPVSEPPKLICPRIEVVSPSLSQISLSNLKPEPSEISHQQQEKSPLRAQSSSSRLAYQPSFTSLKQVASDNFPPKDHAFSLKQTASGMLPQCHSSVILSNAAKPSVPSKPFQEQTSHPEIPLKRQRAQSSSSRLAYQPSFTSLKQVASDNFPQKDHAFSLKQTASGMLPQCHSSVMLSNAAKPSVPSKPFQEQTSHPEIPLKRQPSYVQPSKQPSHVQPSKQPSYVQPSDVQPSKQPSYVQPSVVQPSKQPSYVLVSKQPSYVQPSPSPEQPPKWPSNLSPSKQPSSKSLPSSPVMDKQVQPSPSSTGSDTAMPYFKVLRSRFQDEEVQGRVVEVEVGFSPSGTDRRQRRQRRRSTSREDPRSGLGAGHSPDIHGAGDDFNGVPPTGLLAIGGHVDNDNLMGQTHSHLLSAEAQGWQKKGDMPHTRLHFAAASLRGKIYVTGGYDPCTFFKKTGEHATRSTFQYDPSSSRWKRVADMHGARAFHTVCVLHDRMFVMGGQDKNEEVLKTGEAYDPVADSWCPLPSMENCRVGASSAPLLTLGVLMVVGGYGEGGGHDTATGDPCCPVLMSTERYDLNIGRWQAGGLLREPRAQASLVVVGDYLYLCGGVTRQRCTGQLCSMSDVDRYDPSSDQWTQLTNLTIARHNAGAAALGTKLYVVGGVSTDVEGVLRSVDCFDTDTGKWDISLPHLPYGAKSLACMAITTKDT